MESTVLVQRHAGSRVGDGNSDGDGSSGGTHSDGVGEVVDYCRRLRDKESACHHKFKHSLKIWEEHASIDCAALYPRS